MTHVLAIDPGPTEGGTMRRIVIALLLVLGSLFVLAPTAEANSAYTCHLNTRVARVIRHTHDMKYTWWLRGGIQFLTCSRPGHRKYGIITGSFIAFNRNGTHMNCHWWNPEGSLISMRGNPHMSDAYGNRFNPPEFHAPCDSRTYHKTWRHYDSHKHLFWSGGNTRPPHGVVWYKLEFRRSINIERSVEPHGNFSMPLRANH